MLYIREERGGGGGGDLMEGFLRYDVGRLIFGGAYFRNSKVPLQVAVFALKTTHFMMK